MVKEWSLDNLNLNATQKKAVEKFIKNLLPSTFSDEKFKYYAARWFLSKSFDKTEYQKFLDGYFNDKIHKAYIEYINAYIKKEEADNKIPVPEPKARLKRFLTGNDRLENNAISSDLTNVKPVSDLKKLLRGNRFINDPLPDELQFPKLNWWNIELQFESDFDRACYIVRDEKKQSKKEQEFVDWIKQVSGQSLEDIRKKHCEKVIDVIILLIKKKYGDKGHWKNGPRGKIVVPKIPLDFTPTRSSVSSSSRTGTTRRTGRGAATGARITGRTTTVSRANIVSNQNKSDCCTEQVDILEKILKSIKNIGELLLIQQTLSYSGKRKVYITEEEKRRRNAEKEFEQSTKNLKQSFAKLFTPIQGIMDSIIGFLVANILGKAFIDILKWATDPKNQKMMSSLGRFFKDWWPALLGTFVLYCTSFGKFVRSSVGFVISLGKYIATNGFRALRSILASAGRNALIGGAILAGTVGTGYLVGNAMRASENNSGAPATPNFGTTSPKQSFANGGLVKFLKQRKTNINDISFDGGGPVDRSSGMPITGAGPDTQLVALSPGEYVMTRAAVNRYGSNYFESLNKSVGKISRPGKANNIQLANQGGEVGTAVKHLIEDEKLSSLTPGVNDYISPGLRSSISNTPWALISKNPNTKIYPYRVRSGDAPIIGWGATFYDSLRKGNKPVKMSDVITKSKADNILKFQVQDLSDYYSKNIPYWKYMSANQRAGLAMFGYNAGTYAPLGQYKKISAGLRSGNMRIVAKELQRSGISTKRVALERSLVLSGPLDLKALAEKNKTNVNTNRTNRQKVAFSTQNNPSLSAPGPRPQSGSFDISTLPPIYAGNKNTPAPVAGDTMVESFSATAPSSVSSRKQNAELLGIKGIG